MAHFIDKDVLIAEIESLKSAAETMLTGKTDLSYWKAQKCLCERFLSFLDTLEVKEMDLDYIKDELDRVVKIYKPDGDFGWGTLYNIATHFFDLGLKAKKRKKV